MTLDALKKAAHLQGCVVFDYSKSSLALIALGLYDRSKTSSAMCTQSPNGDKLIFINDSLSEEKQLFSLAHELGHIALNHKATENLEEKKRIEKEADAFAMAVTGKLY